MEEELTLRALIAAHPHESPAQQATILVAGLNQTDGSADASAPLSAKTTIESDDIVSDDTTTTTADLSAGTGTLVSTTPRVFHDLQLTDASAMTLSVSDVPHHTSDRFLSLATGSANDGSVGDLTKLQPEVLHWMAQCRTANGGIAASEDDVLYYFDTKYPELLQIGVNERLFDWLHGFLASVATGESPRFSSEVKDVAMQTLAASPESIPALVVELGLKSTTTLQFWRFQEKKLAAEATEAEAVEAAAAVEAAKAPPTGLRQQLAPKRRVPFAHDAELLEWLLSHKLTPITSQDIVNHLEAQYPDFVEGRTSASMSVWVARFLKRHLPSESSSMTAGLLSDLDDAATASDGREGAYVDQEGDDNHSTEEDADLEPQKRRPKRKSPNGYVLHSNEFKLNALKRLDEGKTITEVSEELDLKCPNTLVYWNSIRDKLAASDKKRFRLAGGGRRSTCTFEDELMNWVSERHQKGVDTDVRSVLDYLQTCHSSFTEGKKEPTLRKWILRFFKRWRHPSAQVGAVAEEDEMDKTNGILV